MLTEMLTIRPACYDGEMNQGLFKTYFCGTSFIFSSEHSLGLEGETLFALTSMHCHIHTHTHTQAWDNILFPGLA